MKRPRAPYEELTDAKNQNILGTLTGRSWNLMQTNRVRAEMYRLGRLVEAMTPMEINDIVLPNGSKGLPTPLAVLMELGMQTSGSISGKHREDLREALRGQRQPGVSLVGAVEDAKKSEERGI